MNGLSIGVLERVNSGVLAVWEWVGGTGVESLDSSFFDARDAVLDEGEAKAKEEAGDMDKVDDISDSVDAGSNIGDKESEDAETEATQAGLGESWRESWSTDKAAPEAT